MKSSSISTLVLILSCSWAASAGDDFLHCLSQQSWISNVVYTPPNSSYNSILQFSIRNLRFDSEYIPKPKVIITPEHESQVPPVVLCARQSGLEIRTRSGGHDFEGLSYVSLQAPFVILDLINLSEITVDVDRKTAWVGAGATVGSLYYRIAEKSPVLGFPAGFCPTVGVGGHFSGGGYGALMRKYGLSADQVIDARIIDVHGRILDRKSMGEDLFWAIRGGGGASFGVIVAWKVRLVDVPETVTVFTVTKTVEQNATQLARQWQYVAPRLDSDLFIGVLLNRVNSTVLFNFFSLFLGGVDRLLPMLQESFPELGVAREDCIEMSWIQSVLYYSGRTAGSSPDQGTAESLLNRTPETLWNFKMKSDYVKEPAPESMFQGIVRLLRQPEGLLSRVYTVPYGGRMAEIQESATPFPHRAGNLYKIACVAYWRDRDGEDSDKYIRWSRRYYDYMTPYVSKSPREVYLNYRDLDIGVNNFGGQTSYEQASIWGMKYFKNNFDRLVKVKTVIDPANFFKNEQSIPPCKTGSKMKLPEAVFSYE
ncbi:berberine bridge enzyme-like 18 [Salvia hispanica]|uniref:berberine bridge enzyme-like 18 n=1 Tax=Salvia hispanica TaxID=49212 RepID=UPI0020096093|nr:berberine bridge enzyme-like 18 [Salvia hispanica]